MATAHALALDQAKEEAASDARTLCLEAEETAGRLANRKAKQASDRALVAAESSRGTERGLE